MKNTTLSTVDIIQNNEGSLLTIVEAPSVGILSLGPDSWPTLNTNINDIQNKTSKWPFYVTKMNIRK